MTARINYLFCFGHKSLADDITGNYLLTVFMYMLYNMCITHVTGTAQFSSGHQLAPAEFEHLEHVISYMYVNLHDTFSSKIIIFNTQNIKYTIEENFAFLSIGSQ